jgi:hypothetical protein
MRLTVATAGEWRSAGENILVEKEITPPRKRTVNGSMTADLAAPSVRHGIRRPGPVGTGKGYGKGNLRSSQMLAGFGESGR